MNDKLKNAIVKNLSDDLLKKEYLKVTNKNKYTGHCYVASEVYYHLSEENLKVFHIKHEENTHWFLKDYFDNIIDLTYKQFKTSIDYENAKRGFFLTKQPSKRSKILMQRILNDKKKL